MAKTYSLEFETKAPESRELSGGKEQDLKWSSGPYLRKNERELWNQLYDEFVEELRTSAGYPEGVVVPAKVIHVLAWNMAYRAIWTLRRLNEQ